MRSITFIHTRTVNNGSGTGQTFEAGKVYELTDESCERWVRRGAARYSDKAPAAVPPSVTIEVSGQSNEVVIPDNWRDLDWFDLRALAKQFNDDVRTKEDAIAAVELEIESRKID